MQTSSVRNKISSPQRETSHAGNDHVVEDLRKKEQSIVADICQRHFLIYYIHTFFSLEKMDRSKEEQRKKWKEKIPMECKQSQPVAY